MKIHPYRPIEHVIDLACQIQQIPSPTFQEGERARFMLEQFQACGLDEVEIDSVGNVWGRLRGGNAAPLVVSAHLDTVYPGGAPVPLKRTKTKITGPAIGDNSLGLAALACAVEHFHGSIEKLPGDLIVVATVCEEGIGNLHGMQAVVSRLSSQPLAYLIVEGIGLGNIYHGGLGVERYRITVETQGGHSWADYGNPSAIHELAGLVTLLCAIPLPKKPRTTLNIGTIEGGISINSIASRASCTLDLRSEDWPTLNKLVQRVQTLVSSSGKEGVHITLQAIGRRPSGFLPASHPLVCLAQECLQELGIPSRLGIASTDANLPLSRGLPAICIGLTSGGNAHTINETIDIEPVGKGMAQMLEIIRRAWSTARR